MQLSVSIPDEDVQFLDEYARNAGLPSRSAALQRAVRSLRALQLRAEYAAAFDEWSVSDDAAAWDRTTACKPADGLADRLADGPADGLTDDAAR